MGCARTRWTRARQRWQWAATTATALAVGCCGGGGTAGSGFGAHGRVARLRSLSSGRRCREPRHEKGEVHDCGAGHRREK